MKVFVDNVVLYPKLTLLIFTSPSNEMRHLDVLVFSPNVELESVLVFDDEFAFLKPSDIRPYLLQFLAADTEQILDDGGLRQKHF